MKNYFDGTNLIGNDFSIVQITQWYNEESEAYADLGNKDKNSFSYGYNTMNKIHGFDKINDLTFDNVLGFGSAWGSEFEPVINKIKKLTIVEPSDNLVSKKIGNLIPTYVKPNIDGSLSFKENLFDLITCFGTLHHIPNVSFVLKELIRVLRPNGHLLIREPIVSMGDWRKQRTGLTKNERGIPISFFNSELKKHSIEIVSKDYCFTATYSIGNAIGSFFKKPIYSYKFYVYFDKYISHFLKNNVHYHSLKKIHKIAPSSIFYVLQKTD